jgi:calcineurin-like phosphoesterase family protein
MTNIWFTSDQHFGHANIIKYTKRPFNNAGEMNEALIKEYNSIVSPNDTVYHLGDFGWHKPEILLKIAQRLNGKKHLILGNHDKTIRKNIHTFTSCFKSIVEYLEITVQDKSISGRNQKIIMSHYPMVEWNGSYHDSWMLHGHCHSNGDWRNLDRLRHDIGVDGNSYRPLSYDDVKRIMSTKNTNKEVNK